MSVHSSLGAHTSEPTIAFGSFGENREIAVLSRWISRMEHQKTNKGKLKVLKQIPNAYASVNHLINSPLVERLRSIFNWFSVKELKEILAWMNRKLPDSCFDAAIDDESIRLIKSIMSPRIFLFYALRAGLDFKKLKREFSQNPDFKLSNEIVLIACRRGLVCR